MIFLICFSFFVVIYLPDIVDKYYKEDTTFVTRKVPIENPTNPTITFCFSHFLKTDVVKNSIVGKPDGVYRGIFLNQGSYYILESNLTVPELFGNATYRLDKDFLLTYRYSRYGREVMNLGRNEMYGMTVTVEEIPTEQNGLCYSLHFMVNKTNNQVWFGIDPKSTLDSEGLTFYVSTYNTRFGIVNRKWSTFKPLIINKSFGFKYLMRMELEEIQWNYHEGNPNCQEGCSLNQCFSHKKFIGISCIPVVLRKWFIGSNLTSCLTLEDNTLTYQEVMRQRQSFSCPLPEYDVEFKAVISDERFEGMKKSQKTIQVYFDQSSSFRYTKKEVLIHDTASLVGSLGGFLGLFIGFSFFGTISFLMNKLCTD